ncbi:hypothetical protein CMV30_14540 [Nibricoccus aquaticus]|uniref:Lipoprotein SmpA/OmlA domain-containing protein n=1 Tax=Nibricoccus aquaticus TaxID=2576891 RepID=A0A290QFM3_9BACT|nr:hypothetical protein [Nibricoccus aquaticus]ATC65076.1 hypothetical protein CMV30_14540 [Nibricoccus aquaticus]
MKTLSTSARLIAVALAGLVVSSVAHAASADSSPAASSNRTLNPGMSAEAIVKQIGRPLGITPIKVAEGQAEIWIYHRQLARETRHTSTSTQAVPAFVGVGGTGGAVIGTTSTAVYSIENITTYQVTSLLMFEGKLRVAKQSQEQTRSFN